MTRADPFPVFLRLACDCGARFEGSTKTDRLKRVIRAFEKAHHHPPKRDALGRFVKWAP